MGKLSKIADWSTRLFKWVSVEDTALSPPGAILTVSSDFNARTSRYRQGTKNCQAPWAQPLGKINIGISDPGVSCDHIIKACPTLLTPSSLILVHTLSLHSSPSQSSHTLHTLHIYISQFLADLNRVEIRTCIWKWMDYLFDVNVRGAINSVKILFL